MAPADVYAIISVKECTQHMRKINSACAHDPNDSDISCIL
jgi:hypothetical protein